MSLKILKIGLVFTLALGLAGVAPALAEEAGRAAIEGEMTFVQGADGYRTATRLGGSRAFYGPVRDINALKRMAANKTVQKNIAAVMDQQGLTAHTQKVLDILAKGEVQESSFPSAERWSGWRSRRRASRTRCRRFAGRQGALRGLHVLHRGRPKIYNFVVPEACGNLALVSVTDKALPECVRIAVDRDCNAKTLAIRATGASIDGKKITKSRSRATARKLGDLMARRASSGAGRGRRPLRLQGDRRVRSRRAICDGRREVSVEECPAPKAVVEPRRPRRAAASSPRR